MQAEEYKNMIIELLERENSAKVLKVIYYILLGSH